MVIFVIIELNVLGQTHLVWGVDFSVFLLGVVIAVDVADWNYA